MFRPQVIKPRSTARVNLRATYWTGAWKKLERPFFKNGWYLVSHQPLQFQNSQIKSDEQFLNTLYIYHRFHKQFYSRHVTPGKKKNCSPFSRRFMPRRGRLSLLVIRRSPGKRNNVNTRDWPEKISLTSSHEKEDKDVSPVSSYVSEKFYYRFDGVKNIARFLRHRGFTVRRPCDTRQSSSRNTRVVNNTKK